MTLHTRVAIVGAIPVREAFDLALRAICIAAGEVHRIENAIIDDPSPAWHDDGVYRLGTQIGQGLPGITWVTYRPDSPLYLEDEFEDGYEDEDGNITICLEAPACSLIIHWDTAYGFNGPGGMGCSDLHSIAIRIVHEELSRRGRQMHWYNEFNGEWNRGIENLASLSAAGLESDLWFRHTALPAVRARLSAGLDRNEESAEQ